MSFRPEHIDVPPIVFSDAPSITSSHSDVPRTPAFADIPPALSPLDALALQGRLLQRRFEEEVTNGRRISRLPANVVADEIAKVRPTYFRSLSQNDVSQVKEPDLPLPMVTQVPYNDRPVSQHPLVQGGYLSGPLRQDTFPPTPRRMPSPLNEISEHHSDVDSVLSEPLEALNFSPSRFPPSPRTGHQARSPSITSEGSVGGRPRPSFNFSRPLSRGQMRPDSQLPEARTWRSDSNASSATRPSMDQSYRFAQGPGESTSAMSRSLEELQRTPNDSVTSEDVLVSEGEGLNGSYIYSTYNLPRGKSVKRESLGPQDFLIQQINWNRASRDQLKAALQNSSPIPTSARTSAENLGTIPERPKPADLMIPIQRSNTTVESPATRRINHKPTTSSPSTLQSDAATVRPSLGSTATSPAMSTEDHFQKGIECHEKDLLQESTYHFRIAARAGHSKAMLFYALACRHGWGIKPNAQEGVIWLQKAVDSSQLEIADDEDLLKSGQQTDLADRKSHKAQFALSVYELGVSYMKGWGVTQDKALALRCFEIAGNWGDVDALAEAGFCYVEGIGCKKDMKKAAGLYRQAEAKGMSMAGNSWIYKEKYMAPSLDDRPDARSRDSPRSDKRSKSRTRNFFGRKKSVVS